MMAVFEEVPVRAGSTKGCPGSVVGTMVASTTRKVCTPGVAGAPSSTVPSGRTFIASRTMPFALACCSPQRMTAALP